jgi:hypothetical protein
MTIPNFYDNIDQTHTGGRILARWLKKTSSAFIAAIVNATVYDTQSTV